MILLRRLRFPLAVCSGLVLMLAFPGWNWEPAVWLWVMPLLGVLWFSDLSTEPSPSHWKRWWRKSQTFRLGWVAGAAFYLTNLSWLRHSSRVIFGATCNEWMGFPVEALGWSAVAGMGLFLAIYVGLWAAFVAACARPSLSVWRFGSVIEASWETIRCATLCGLAWVTLEWMRGWVFTGFGWNGLGVALHGNKTIIQAADLVGVSGIAFTPMFCAATLLGVGVRLLVQGQGGKRLRYHFDTLAAVLLLLAQMLYGISRLGEPERDSVPLRVALVQQNVPQRDILRHENYEEHYQRYAELTQLMVQPRGDEKKSDIDLVVWPESALALPWDAPAHESFFNPLLALGDFSLFAGVDDKPVAGPEHTGAMLMHKAFNGTQTYWKVHLVPFGEYLPIRSLLGPVLGGVLPGDFAPGEKTEPLPLQNSPVQAIPLVCFEDTVGDLARRFVRDEPQVLVNMTNDGWFLQSAEPEQHLNNSIFRAIELRRPLCRATNTGVTAFIDDRGRVVASLRDPQSGSTFIEGVLPRTVNVPRHPPATLYARWGDWFAMLSGALCLLTLALQHWPRRDTSHSAPAVPA